MEAGDKVICVRSYGYAFTTGQEYVIIEYHPSVYHEYFIWPAYVTVMDDDGRLAHCHANRFKEVA